MEHIDPIQNAEVYLFGAFVVAILIQSIVLAFLAWERKKFQRLQTTWRAKT